MVKMPRRICLKHRIVPNFVTDWWERFVYLRGRDPIMINSNYYIMDAYEWIPTPNPVARAANLIFSIMEYKVCSPSLSQRCSRCRRFLIASSWNQF
jgi:carnitine O-palmitoyltransferase 1